MSRLEGIDLLAHYPMTGVMIKKMFLFRSVCRASLVRMNHARRVRAPGKASVRAITKGEDWSEEGGAKAIPPRQAEPRPGRACNTARLAERDDVKLTTRFDSDNPRNRIAPGRLAPRRIQIQERFGEIGRAHV